jgi:ferric-dicitrate binding protein FerR (iron transport regulator)
MPYKDREAFQAYRERTKEHRRDTFREWETKNREKRAAYKRELRAKKPRASTPEEREKRNAYKHPERAVVDIERLRVREYGVTPERFAAMVAAQDGKCAICAKPPQGSFHVDHCHETGEVRDLLCGKCNRGLGMYHDDPRLLTRAAWYLDRHKHAAARRSA